MEIKETCGRNRVMRGRGSVKLLKYASLEDQVVTSAASGVQEFGALKFSLELMGHVLDQP